MKPKNMSKKEWKDKKKYFNLVIKQKKDGKKIKYKNKILGVFNA